jgi:hypothetical protein
MSTVCEEGTLTLDELVERYLEAHREMNKGSSGLGTTLVAKGRSDERKRILAPLVSRLNGIPVARLTREKVGSRLVAEWAFHARSTAAAAGGRQNGFHHLGTDGRSVATSASARPTRTSTGTTTRLSTRRPSISSS